MKMVMMNEKDRELTDQLEGLVDGEAGVQVGAQTKEPHHIAMLHLSVE